MNWLEPPPAAFLARRKSYSWLVVGTVSIGSFMAQLDASIVQLLMPTIERQFGVRLGAASWVAVAYLLTLAACLPIFARLADMWGRKLLYIGGFVCFVLGSALCGLSPNLPLLVGFRVVQAIGAALMASNSVATLVTVAGPERRGRAIGIQGAAQAIGLSVGPALGGLLLDTLGWRWVFWINLPFGFAGAVAAWFVLPQTTKMSRDRRFDWLGALLIAPALATMLILLNDESGQGSSSPAAISTALLACLLIALFFYVERRENPPLVDLRLLHKRAFIAGALAGFLSNAALFGTFFLMTFVFVRGYRDTALTAGLMLSVVPVALSLIAPHGGALSDRLGARVLTFTGMVTCVAALALLYLGMDRTQCVQPPLIMLSLAVFGLGQGLFTAPNNSAVMGAAPEGLVGEAGGLLNVTRALGMSVGIAAASALLSWRLQDTTLTAAPHALIAAARGAVLLLAGFAAAAGLLSLVRTDRAGKQIRSKPGEGSSTQHLRDLKRSAAQSAASRRPAGARELPTPGMSLERKAHPRTCV
jgi:EmrB/QacA subfamily drug resistance transporter